MPPRAQPYLLQASFHPATHSPILLAYPHAGIIQFDETGVRAVGYTETDHYRVSRDFLNHYPRRLEQLLAEDERSAPD